MGSDFHHDACVLSMQHCLQRLQVFTLQPSRDCFGHCKVSSTHVGHVHYVNNVAFVRPILTFVFLLISSTGSAGSERDKY